MKYTLIVTVLVSILFAACEDNELKDAERLAKRLSGEWNIVQMTFPANDSTIQANGQAKFGSCINNCSGYFSIDNEIVNFDYSVVHFPDIPSQISMGPTDGNPDNVLRLQASTYNILVLDEHNLTIDLAYCEFTDNVCTTIHRHIVMNR